MKAKEVKDSPDRWGTSAAFFAHLSASHFIEPLYPGTHWMFDVVPCFENVVEVGQNDG